MQAERILWDAELNPRVKSYWLLAGTITCIVSVVGLVVLPFWVVLGHRLLDRYIKTIRCTLTDRSLILKKGIWNRVEKNLPLDKITDVGLNQGPLMRWYDLEALSFETAGQSSGMAPLLSITGIVDGRAFRDAVIRQRDRVVDRERGEDSAEPRQPPQRAEAEESTVQLLREIRDVLGRIEANLAESPQR